MQVPVSRSRPAVYHAGNAVPGLYTGPPIVHQRMNQPTDIAAFVNERDEGDDAAGLQQQQLDYYAVSEATASASHSPALSLPASSVEPVRT
jgi:hypothetical protein